MCSVPRGCSPSTDPPARRPPRLQTDTQQQLMGGLVPLVFASVSFVRDYEDNSLLQMDPYDESRLRAAAGQRVTSFTGEKS